MPGTTCGVEKIFPSCTSPKTPTPNPTLSIRPQQWTHTRALFERFCGELEADTAQTLLDWEVSEYTIMPAEPPRALPELRLLPVDGLRARYVDSFLLRGNERRYLDAFQKIQRAKTASAGRAPTRTAAILNATPRTFWALYLAEWTQWYTERLIQDDPHWPYLWRLLAAISAAETGALFPDLEKALPAGGVRSIRSTVAQSCSPLASEGRAPSIRASGASRLGCMRSATPQAP